MPSSPAHIVSLCTPRWPKKWGTVALPHPPDLPDPRSWSVLLFTHTYHPLHPTPMRCRPPDPPMLNFLQAVLSAFFLIGASILPSRKEGTLHAEHSAALVGDDAGD